MESYDLGCSYSGGSDPESILTGAGLSFVSQSQSNWRKSMATQFFSLSKCNLSKFSSKAWLKTRHNVAATTDAEIKHLISHHQHATIAIFVEFKWCYAFPGVECNSRQKRSLDLEQERITLSKTALQLCFKISSTVKKKKKSCCMFSKCVFPFLCGVTFRIKLFGWKVETMLRSGVFLHPYETNMPGKSAEGLYGG